MDLVKEVLPFFAKVEALSKKKVGTVNNPLNVRLPLAAVYCCRSRCPDCPSEPLAPACPAQGKNRQTGQVALSLDE